MSKTSDEVLNILYQDILNSNLFSVSNKPTGGLYKRQRPLNSNKEDVVINSLPINREQLQQGVLNVNIYVPNLSLMINGLSDNTQPDNARISELSKLFSDAFQEVDGDNGNYTFAIQQDLVFEDDNNQHYVNYRIDYSSVNI